MTEEDILKSIETLDSLRENSKLIEAKELAFELLENDEIQKDSKILALLYNRIGIINEKLSDYLKSIEYYKKALKITTDIQNKEGIAANYGGIGLVYRHLNDYPKAMEYFEKALQINVEIEHKEQIARNFGYMGNIYNDLSDNTKAIEFYEKALRIFEELERKDGIAVIIGNIGNVYLYNADYLKAIEYYKKALRINEELGRKEGISINFGNIGNAYIDLADYPNALEFIYKALQIDEEIGDKIGVANNFGNIGLVYSLLSDYSKAIEYFQMALQINEEIGSKQGTTMNYGNIGIAYTELGDFQNAVKYLNTSYNLAVEIGDKEMLMQLYKAYTDLYEKLGNMNLAFSYQKQYFEIKEEIQSEESKRKSILFDQKRILEEDEKNRQVKLARFQEKERLLHDILPSDIAERILQGETTIAEKNDNVSLFFSDIVGFTTISQTVEPEILVKELNTIFQEYDRIAKKYSVEKIKTIGDAYMAVSGLNPTIEHPHYNIAMFAMEVIDSLQKLTLGRNHFQIRVGLHVGKVVSGVIGGYKFTFDIWGDTVNIASRMESHSEPGRIHITEEFANKMKTYPEFNTIPRGEITIKGKGTMNTFWLEKAK